MVVSKIKNDTVTMLCPVIKSFKIHCHRNKDFVKREVEINVQEIWNFVVEM